MCAQGNCSEPFERFRFGDPVGTLLAGQCAINTPGRFLLWDEAPRQPDVWIDRLFLTYSKPSPEFALVLFAPQATSARLWVTALTVSGGGAAQGLDLGNGAAYIAGALPSYNDGI